MRWLEWLLLCYISSTLLLVDPLAVGQPWVLEHKILVTVTYSDVSPIANSSYWKKEDVIEKNHI